MLYGLHKNTVRGWLKSGLEPIDSGRPTLILGRRLSRFLHARRAQSRQRCRPGQFYCLRCRAPKDPVLRKADYLPVTSTSGNLKGMCGDCGCHIYRRVSVHKLPASVGNLEPRPENERVKRTYPGAPRATSMSARRATSSPTALRASIAGRAWQADGCVGIPARSAAARIAGKLAGAFTSSRPAN